MRRQYCHPSTFLYYREPLMVVEGFMQYLYDETGRRYLDMFAGIVTVSCGHSHPKFVERLEGADRRHPAHHDDLPAPELPADGPAPGGEDAARARRHLLRQQRQRGQRPGGADGPRLHGAQRRHRRAERLPRRLALDHGAHLAPHLEVPPAAQPRRPPRDQSRPLPEPVHRHAGGDRPEERRGHPRSRSGTPRRAGSPRSSPSRSRASAGRRTARRTTSARPTPSRASTAASASPTRCRPASAAPASTTGASRTPASCPTSSPWPRASGTAGRSPP